MQTRSTPQIAIARHETFHLRDGWIPKALHSVRDDSLALSRTDAHHELGVGKNMLNSIRYWVWAAHLAEPVNTKRTNPIEYRLTDLGRRLLDHDPFFEDERTLWLSHIEMASSLDRASFWYWLFNLYSGFDFSEADAVEGFRSFIVELGIDSPNVGSVKKDLHVLLRTYVPMHSSRLEENVSPLCSLDLLRVQPGGARYRFNFEKSTIIDPWVVGYALCRFVERQRPDNAVVTVDELRWAACSPGRLLCLDTRKITEALEALERMRVLTLSRTAGLGNVHLNRLDSNAVLAQIYES